MPMQSKTIEAMPASFAVAGFANAVHGSLRWLGLACALLAVNTTARAANLFSNYKASQWTGWTNADGNINTVGGNRSPMNFTDGTADGLQYQISLLSFGQFNSPPDPVYEGSPANATIKYSSVLNTAYGPTTKTNDFFNYMGGFDPKGTDEFQIQSYTTFASNGGVVGADMYAIYTPSPTGPTDPALPKAAGGNLHWIQVLWNNWQLVGNVGKPGTVANNVDVPTGQVNPYYDTIGAAGLATNLTPTVFNFYDAPARNSGDLATYNFNNGPLQWMAEDFLVQDTGMQNGMNQEVINVYGGIEYGWQVTLLPEPASLGLAAIGILFSVIARRPRTVGK